MTHSIVLLLVLCFPVSEVAIAVFKRGSSAAAVDDRGSMRLLWMVIVPSVALAVAASDYRATGLPCSAAAREFVAATLLGGGLALRWIAILTLGRYFTANVAVQPGQSVISAGPYRHLRHPSYTGLLLAFLGLGVFFGNWLSLAALMVPITLAIVYRLRLEESVLVGALGQPYSAYCARTKRLIPFVW